jgi:hypothetical protein
MNRAEKAAKLAEHVMGFHNTEMGLGIRWWADFHSNGDVRARYPVERWMRQPDVPYWNPFEDIRQAKLVQAAMRARGWGIHIHDKGTSSVLVVMDAPGDVQTAAIDGEWAEATEDIEAAAISEAAGRALGLWARNREVTQ